MAVVTSEQLRGAAQGLADYAAAHGLTGADDRVWAYNAILECAGATGPAPAPGWVLGTPAPGDAFDLDATLAAISEAAVANGVADDTASGRDRASCRVMGLLMPRPSQVSARFHELAAHDPKAATDWFYQLCCDAGYVRRSAIARNVEWSTPTRWGDLEITINLSKPEKDPREIAAAGVAANDGEKYPACQLCVENEGYPGCAASAPGGAHPARQNLRIIPLELGGERWGLQYSPYAYFNEHCIAMSAHHRPMHIDRATLGCLLDFVDTVPHYFIGSNADLPIVGGSILSHDHFQGGAHEFPMMRAATAETFAMAAHPNVGGEVLEWPLSVLRLTAASRDELLGACVHVIDAWRSWSDVAAGVIARDEDGTPHNTVTPVIRRVGERYEAYLALRCNVTTSEHPLGVFHPHAEYHHIKRENIGLIEVMGLAILPPRLVPELEAVRGHLLAGDLDALEADELTASHATWARDVYARRAAELTPEGALDVLHEEVGAVFGRVLENAGVFKWDEAGRTAQRRFLDSL
ncbi:UDP-glucose--hexose-1-phosphate uridylyltransferase [uncultured Parolsenella sp.]|uniref:UDP-glucose--hexose-1-phosphate uridylyltransferase n=1 Tax=uncultured Parolsenella sp. TaxID=2083008 RepID=UPI0028046CC7|nr:UDP-glucose--hexose-1-phosphate uridylyltransferase [uncultured Parolsenella sp.]